MLNVLSQVTCFLTLCLRNRDALKLFLDKGVAIKETPKDIAEASDVVITMLPSSSHVRNFAFWSLLLLLSMLLWPYGSRFSSCILKVIPNDNHSMIDDYNAQQIMNLLIMA